jgi:hypothetical protein
LLDITDSLGTTTLASFSDSLSVADIHVALRARGRFELDNGGGATTVNVSSNPTSLDVEDVSRVRITASSGNYTLNLTDMHDGQVIFIRNETENTITIGSTNPTLQLGNGNQTFIIYDSTVGAWLSHNTTLS